MKAHIKVKPMDDQSWKNLRIMTHRFNIKAYVMTFDFQTLEEKRWLYALLRQIWYENYGTYGE